MGRIGQNVAQVIDRSAQMKDLVKLSVQIPTCHTSEDEHSANIQINRALLELTRNGGGPVHINLETTYSSNFTIESIPYVRPIYRIGYNDKMPELSQQRIGIFVGAHLRWSKHLTEAVNKFCSVYNAVVLCDQTSNYRGPYRVLFSLVTSQTDYFPSCNEYDLLIYIGDVSGAYPRFNSHNEWRINPDGEVRDLFGRLSYVFAMDETYFFEAYTHAIAPDNSHKSEQLLNAWMSEYKKVYDSLPELPFSNIWVAKETAGKLPEGSILHLGILNTLRSWNFFETPNSVTCYCNTGGFGIDGINSAAIGTALASPDKTIFCVIGDLAFFYDLNSLGNRHVPRNLRVLLINNGVGTEFRNYNHPGAKFGEDADPYIAAAGHYGAKNRDLVKHYAQDLGYKYISASNKEEYLNNMKYFVSDSKYNKPIIFEVFTRWEDESSALKLVNYTCVDGKTKLKNEAKSVIRGVAGEKGIKAIKKILGR